MSSAVIQECETSREPLPVCLWKENPYRLVSLWDMLVFNAAKFYSMASVIEYLKIKLEKLLAGRDLVGDEVRLVLPMISRMRGDCSDLGLSVATLKCDRLFEAFRPDGRVDRLWQAIDEFQNTVQDELSTYLFLHVSNHERAYYDSAEPLFGNKVFSNFGSATYDIAEAGNCLALGRSTAVVFHLMRVMESGLKVAARKLGIPYAPSWESYIGQINKLIAADWKTKTPELKADEPFYKELAGDLQTIKIAWRNPTMHIVRKYTQEEARNVFMAVKGFMQRLAEKPLSE